MSEIEELKDKIKKWLVSDNLVFSEAKNNQADFQFVLSNAFGLGFVIDIAKPKDKPMLAIAMRLLNPPQVQQGYSALNVVEKLKVIEGLKRDLLKFGIDYNISDNIGTVTIINYLYTDDMTHTLFMDSLKRVRNSALFVISTLAEKFTSGVPSIPPHSHSDLRSPYG